MGCCEFQHLWRIVTALAGMHGRRSLARIEDLTNKERTRQAIAHFLTRAQWNAPQLLWQTALDTLRQLGFRPGETAWVALVTNEVRWSAKTIVGHY